MKIVFDIDEDYYELIKHDVNNGMDYLPCKLIANGKPLPKGHGKLIDADDIKSYFSDREGDDFTAFHFYDAVESAQTIIEADKAESEDKSC